MKYFSNRKIFVVSIIYLLLMTIAAFYDYQISLSVVNINSFFGKFFAAYGMLPLTVGLFFIAIVFFKLHKHYIIANILILLALYELYINPVRFYEDFNMYLSVGFSSLVLVFIVYFTISYINKHSDDELLNFAYYLLFVIIFTMLTVELFKQIIARPRMRLLLINDDVSFHNFYQIGLSQKEFFMLEHNIPSEEFKSFPSGHTASAAIFLAFTLATKNKKKRNYIFSIALIFTMIVAFTRILVGAHFLSDVSTGFYICFVICTILERKAFYAK